MTVEAAIEEGRRRLRQLRPVARDRTISEALLDLADISGTHAGDVLALWALGLVASHVQGSRLDALAVTTMAYAASSPRVDAVALSRLLLDPDPWRRDIAIEAALGAIGAIRSFDGMEAICAMAEISEAPEADSGIAR